MKEIWLRIKLASPLFFRRLTAVCSGLFAAAVFMKAQGVDYHVFNTSLVDLGIGANALAIFVSSLTVKDKEELNTKLND